jgi:hypothetical protein
MRGVAQSDGENIEAWGRNGMRTIHEEDQSGLMNGPDQP